MLMSASKRQCWKFLVAALVVVPFVVPAAESQERVKESKRIVALIITDSKDKNIGASVKKDGERLRQTLEDGFSKNKEQLALQPTVDGDKVTPDEVLDVVKGVAVKETETLFVYYSGHGANDETKGQYLQMYSGPQGKKGDLFRATLLAELKKKKARLTVLITDCCNAEAPSRAPLTRDLTKPPHYETLRYLLLLPEGLVDITSSSRGEFSWSWFPDKDGNEMGGLFTVPLVDLFRIPLKPGQSLTWDDGYALLKKWTQEDYSKYREVWLEAFSKVPEDKRSEGLTRVADMLRKQKGQTVHAYALPGGK